MLFGGVGRLETQFAGNFCARRGRAGAGDGALNQLEDLLLPCREFGSFGQSGNVAENGHGMAPVEVFVRLLF